MRCTFFGHRDTPHSIAGVLRVVLTRLITENGVEDFYVGNQGGFDSMACRVLKELRESYPCIHCTVVLAYMPQREEDVPSDMPSVYPEEVTKYPRRFAILARNQWMLKQADYVVTYTERDGGAAKMEEIARRKGKKVINLASDDVFR